MPTIKARIGSQNVVRVLSNASSPPTRLFDLFDVNTTYSAQDGMILVWDLPTNTFIMTSVIDSSSSTIQGIAYFENQTNSSLPTNGALIVSGGVGIGKNLNVDGDLSVNGLTTLQSITTVNAPFIVNDIVNITGVATFGSDLDINAAVDILNELVVNGTLDVVGPTTLASAGGITTTGGDLFVATNTNIGGNLKVDGTSEFIGNAIFRGGTIGIGDSVTDDINVSGEFISNLVPNEDDTYDLGITTQRWRNGIFSGLVTTTNLYVAGLSTFTDDLDINGDVNIVGLISVTEGLYYETVDVNAPNGISYFDSTGKLVTSPNTFNSTDTSNYILTTDLANLPIWTTTIDGGEF